MLKKKMHKNTPIVSVPYRGATFLNLSSSGLQTRDICFRPLSGSYISQLAIILITLFFVTCFRPLSGSYISQLKTPNGLGKLNLFPSPIGELHFSIVLKLLSDRNRVFPSPIGELHFSMGIIPDFPATDYSFRPLSGSYISQYSKIEAFQQNLCIVSVPYRGATFLNEMFLKVQSLYHVSVPYRGATFLNKTLDTFTPACSAFPSPIGELHFSIMNTDRKV